jgi:hypothetical protein
MFCCEDLTALHDRGHVVMSPLGRLEGRILTEFDTEYFLEFGQDRKTYAGLNYCPFCGRALSRDLWNREKKK